MIVDGTAGAETAADIEIEKQIEARTGTEIRQGGTGVDNTIVRRTSVM